MAQSQARLGKPMKILPINLSLTLAVLIIPAVFAGEAVPVGSSLQLVYRMDQIKADPSGLKVPISRSRYQALPLLRPVPIGNETRQSIATATTSTLSYRFDWRPGMSLVTSVAALGAGQVNETLGGSVRFEVEIGREGGGILWNVAHSVALVAGTGETKEIKGSTAWHRMEVSASKEQKDFNGAVILRLIVRGFDGAGREVVATPENSTPLGALAYWGEPRILDESKAEGKEAPSLFLITFDTLRADALLRGKDAGRQLRTPQFDGLANRGYVFAHCYSPTAWTLPAYQALFSGLHPAQLGYGQADTRDPNEENLAKLRYGRSDVLPALLNRERGYYCFSATGGGMLEPWQNNFLKGFSYYWANPKLEALPNQDGLMCTEAWFNARRFEGQLADCGSGPIFGFYHTYEPHTPYQDTRYVRGMKAGRVKAPFGEGKYLYGNVRGLWADYDQDEKAYLRALYDGDVAASDDALKYILASIKNSGHGDRCWIVITADHGEEFWEHGGMSHGHSLYDELLRVPLLVIPPGGLEKRVEIETPVSLLDLLPTLCDLAGVKPPANLLGRSLKPLLIPDPAVRSEVRLSSSPGLFAACGTYHGPGRWALRKGKYKYIRSLGVQVWAKDDSNRKMLRLEPEELYDIEADPGEQTNLVAEEASKDTLRNMAEALELLMAGPLNPLPLTRADKTVKPLPSDPETLEKLKKLGY